MGEIEDGGAAGGKAAEEGRGPSGDRGARSYFVVWGYFLVLTAITVSAASLNLGRIAVVIVLAIAAAKSSLVLLHFMHLKEEKRVIIRVLVPIVIVLLAIFIGLTYTDVLNRRGG
jgi:caa(3)-type oxidase subunit IV